MDASGASEEAVFPEPVAAEYELDRELGRGAQGIAYLARDRDSGDRVVVKRLSLPMAPDWKSIELFEREAEVLRQLDHPRIPSYLDEFSLGVDAAAEGEEPTVEVPEFYLVREYAPGTPLQSLVDDGETWEGPDLERFLEEMLEVLSYLHDKNPPVVHRDIKPANIVWSEEELQLGGIEVSASEADVYRLVDFGTVQEALAPQEGGSTFVGTAGFMPPEQMRGQARPASDLYALGATALHLASGRHPSDHFGSDMQLDVRSHTDLDSKLRWLLDGLLAPDLGDRYADAEAVLEDLRGRSTLDVEGPRGAEEDEGAGADRGRGSNVDAEPVNDDDPTRGFGWRHAVIASGLAVGGVVGTMIAAWLIGSGGAVVVLLGTAATFIQFLKSNLDSFRNT